MINGILTGKPSICHGQRQVFPYLFPHGHRQIRRSEKVIGGKKTISRDQPALARFFQQNLAISASYLKCPSTRSLPGVQVLDSAKAPGSVLRREGCQIAEKWQGQRTFPDGLMTRDPSLVWRLMQRFNQ